MASGTRTVDKLKVAPGFFQAAASSSTPTYISMKGYNNLTIILTWVNGGSGVTGSAITVKQAKWVNANSEKACQLDYQWASNDCNNSVNLTQTAIASNTFTLDNTGAGCGIAIVEVRADRMDLANGFTALRAGIGNTVNQTVGVMYVLGNVPRFSGGYNSFMNPLVD